MPRTSHLPLLSTLLTLSLVALSAPSKAQSNLVFNPSFEEHRECPRKIDALGTLTIVEAWFQPTKGSADYYHVCGSRDCGVPKNKLGIQEARTGEGFCGIYCSKTDYREYLQTQLREPLRKGETYRLSFHVSLSEYAAGAVATIGGLFTKERLLDTVSGVLMRKELRQITPFVTQTVATYYEPQVVNAYDNPIVDYRHWTPIAGEFVAQGGEEYLTLGNFYPADKSHLVDIDSLTYLLPGAYYYIEDVEVVCLTCGQHTADTLEAPAQKDTVAYAVGSTFILENIFFDFDKSVLLMQSYKELQHLLNILHTHPTMRIEIGGHTDGRGSDDYNQRLSESRAKAVVDYLVEKGIEPRRLRHKGYGKQHPIAPNDTDEGRARNRRVEFRILSM